MTDRHARGTAVVRGGRVVFASEGAAAILGLSPAQVVGRDVLDFLVPEDRDRLGDRYLRRRRGDAAPAEYEATLLRPDGSRRVVTIEAVVFGEDSIVHVRDVTAEAARRPRLEALAALGAAIQRERTEAAVLGRVADGLAELGLSAFHLAAEPNHVRLRWARVPDVVARALELAAGQPMQGFRGAWGPFSRRVWNEGAAYSDDWGADVAGAVPGALGERIRATVQGLGLTHNVAVRLDEREGARSYLELVGDWLRAGDVAAVRLFGAQVAAALDAARTIGELSRHNADLAALNRLGELAGATADLATFFGRAEEVLRATTGCAGLAVFVLDPAAGDLVLAWDSAAGGAQAPGVPEVRQPLDSPIGEVVRERLARVVTLDPSEAGHAPLTRFDHTAAAWVPLAARSRPVGLLAVAFTAGPDEVRSRLELLTAAGAHLASAIESHHLLDDLRRRVSELTLLNDMALASAQLDPVLLLGNALRRVSETLHADAAAAWVRDGDELVRVASFGIDEAQGDRFGDRITVGEALPGRAVSLLAPVRAERATATGLDAAAMEAAGLQSSVAVPLLAKGQVAVGAIAVARRAGPPQAEHEVSLLQAVGVQLGVAVENARLFADVRRRLADLEAVHALALEIFANAPGDVRGLLEAGCRQAARALSCRAAAVLLVDPADPGTLRGVASFGAPFDAETFRIPLASDRLSADAIAHKAPAWSADVSRDPRSVMCGNPRVPPLAMLAVPLTSRTSTRGVLFLADDAGRRFDDAELALATALAGQFAVGLENAELYDETQRRVEELQVLAEVGRTIAGSLDLDRVLAAGVEAARKLVDATGGYVILYDAARGELRMGFSAGKAPADPTWSRSVDGPGAAARAIRERHPVQIEDTATDPDVDPAYLERYGGKSLLVVPILLGGEPLGVVVVDEHRRTRRFTEAEVQRVQAISNQLAVAIENARLFAEARGRLAELSTVIDVARVVSSSLDLAQVLRAGASHLRQTLGAAACTILLVDGRGHRLRRAAADGPPLGPPDRLSLDEPSLAREALAARAPVGSAGPGGTRLLAVPLHVRDEPVGVALVSRAARPGDGALASPGELSRALAIANQLAVAVDNARLYEETRRRAEDLALLQEVGRSLVETLDLQQVLEAGANALAGMSEAGATVSLLSEDGKTLTIRAARGEGGRLVGHEIAVDRPRESIAAFVVSRREPVVVEDVRTDARLRIDPHRFSGRAFIGVPMLAHDRCVGAVVVFDANGPRRFGAGEVDRVAAVANQLAVAAENARLYEDLRRSYADLANAQRQLIQQERLAALGELAAVVAHEVRNPLGVIFNSLGSLRRMLRPEGDAAMLMDILGEEADRLDRIVGDLLSFARPSTPDLRPERLDRVVEEAVSAALAQGSAGIEVFRDPDPSLPAVPLDARLVRQAVLNVAINAAQAMPRGGRLTVRTRREANMALLELEDTGGGIPDEVRARIFEPFFTTKASGTGLGLAVVKRIVEGHGGDISVRSRPGAGSTFALRFPLEPAGTPVESRGRIG